MAKEVWRLHSFAIGMEATAGTAGAIDAWVPFETASLKPMTNLEKDPSGINNIAGLMDAHVTKTWGEFEAKGIVRPTSIGWFILSALGTSAAPALQETGVYKHAFTVKNDNAHPTFTIIHDNATAEEQCLYTMLDELTISGDAGQYARFDVKATGRLPASATGNTPTFTATGETPFLTSKASIKFATNIAGITGATRVPCQSFKVTIEKNLEQIFSTSADGTEALNFSTQHNQDLWVKWDFEIVYDLNTYRDLANAGTLQALEIQLEGRTLIGATKYENITIQLASVVLEDWGRSDDNNGIVTQSFGFSALYKLAESKMITIDVTNAKSTQYS
mgnify:CR=1 FL=1